METLKYNNTVYRLNFSILRGCKILFICIVAGLQNTIEKQLLVFLILVSVLFLCRWGKKFRENVKKSKKFLIASSILYCSASTYFIINLSEKSAFFIILFSLIFSLISFFLFSKRRMLSFFSFLYIATALNYDMKFATNRADDIFENIARVGCISTDGLSRSYLLDYSYYKYNQSIDVYDKKFFVFRDKVRVNLKTGFVRHLPFESGKMERFVFCDDLAFYNVRIVGDE